MRHTLQLTFLLMIALCLASPSEAQTQRRGVMVRPDVTAGEIYELGTWNCNLIRYQLTWVNGNLDDRTAYREWLNGRLQHLDAMLPVCNAMGIGVVIDLHSAPGGLTDQKGLHRVLRRDHWSREEFKSTWIEIARRYVNRGVVGYDLLNEPRGALESWRELARDTGRAIRKVDPNTPIIIQSLYGDPTRLKDFQPVKVKNVVYSIHMYAPMRFTHQGVDGRPMGAVYPGTISGRTWNRKKLREFLQPIADYGRANGVKIYVGEFSAARWAEGGDQYVDDLIRIFERFGWDYSYHAYREADVWWIEPNRELILRSWFDLN